MCWKRKQAFWPNRAAIWDSRYDLLPGNYSILWNVTPVSARDNTPFHENRKTAIRGRINDNSLSISFFHFRRICFTLARARTHTGPNAVHRGNGFNSISMLSECNEFGRSHKVSFFFSFSLFRIRLLRKLNSVTETPSQCLRAFISSLPWGRWVVW